MGVGRRPAAVVATLALSMSACGDDGPVTSASTPVPDAEVIEVGEVVEVAALDNRFEPKTLTVAAGTPVRFVNRGRNQHDTRSVDGEPWGVATADFGPGEEFVHRFEQPGTYRYYCSLHGIVDFGMIGIIVVEGPG